MTVPRVPANPDSSIEFDLTETSTEALSAIVDEAPDRAFTGAEPPEFDLNFETADTNFDTPDLDLDFDSAEFCPRTARTQSRLQRYAIGGRSPSPGRVLLTGTSSRSGA